MHVHQVRPECIEPCGKLAHRPTGIDTADKSADLAGEPLGNVATVAGELLDFDTRFAQHAYGGARRVVGTSTAAMEVVCVQHSHLR